MGVAIVKLGRFGNEMVTFTHFFRKLALARYLPLDRLNISRFDGGDELL
jgi:hypothetical protein